MARVFELAQFAAIATPTLAGREVAIRVACGIIEARVLQRTRISAEIVCALALRMFKSRITPRVRGSNRARVIFYKTIKLFDTILFRIGMVIQYCI